MEHVLPADNSSLKSQEEERAPFLIRVEHLDVDRRGAFRPAASVRFASSLRTSGLLMAMPPEAVKDLLTILTFVSPNGVCAPHIGQLAEAMGVPVAKARNRVERLTSVRFQGQKLVVGNQRTNGLDTCSPLLWLAPVREDASPPHRSDEAQPILYAAPRQAVIDHSRATYARPRAEVEREVERQLGNYRHSDNSLPKKSDPTQSQKEQTHQSAADLSQTAEIRRLLIEVGLLPEQAEALLERHNLLSIRRQLAWLPHRGAKNPAGFLMAAVKDNYEAPPALRPLPESELSSHAQEIDGPNDNLKISLEIPQAHKEL